MRHQPYFIQNLVPRVALVFAALLAGLAMSGCDRGSGVGDSFQASEPEFGDEYQIVLGQHATSTDEPPAVEADTFYTSVTYSGGCNDHDFSLGYRASRDTTEMWLHHDNNDDDCEALIYDRLAIPLPDEARDADVLLFLDPTSDFTFIVNR